MMHFRQYLKKKFANNFFSNNIHTFIFVVKIVIKVKTNYWDSQMVRFSPPSTLLKKGLSEKPA